jgi:hypothetical protein
MRLTFITLFFSTLSFGQYSNYYGGYDYTVKADVNVKQDVNVNANINKTVTTIDYGALANANATRERNRIESLRIANEKDRDAMIAIASDPSKAFDYGTDNDWKAPSKIRKSYGWSSKIKYMYHKIPHESLFINGGSEGYTYINESENGIFTELIIYPAYALSKFPANQQEFYDDIEKSLKYPNYVVGELNDLDGDGKKKCFLHKTDLNKAKVARLDGFVGTLIFEDDYEKRITDNYISIGKNKDVTYVIRAKVRYKVDKDTGSFEELEGRRYYLRPFINKTISTVNFH